MDLESIFGTALPKEQIKNLKPRLPFQEGVIRYYQNAEKTCIEQEFKGRLGYLQQYDIALNEPVAIPIKITQHDLYTAYVMQATKPISLANTEKDLLLKIPERRAFYIYLPSGNYSLQLAAGSYQLFGFYFDIGIFDDGADRSFDFLQPLLEAHRTKLNSHLKSIDFMIGPITKNQVKKLCSSLKKGDLDSQIYIIQQLKDLIQLSKIKIAWEKEGISKDEYYVQLCKKLIQEGVKAEGVTYRLSSLSASLPFSRGHMERILKKSTQIRLLTFRNNCIIEIAKEALQEGQSIWQVSLLLKYAEERSFRHFFKKQTGISPQEYQQQYKNQTNNL